MSVAGHTALVTGSSRGLGFEIAKGLASAGATVYLNGRDPDRLAAAAHQLAEFGLTVLPLPFDITDHTAAAEAVDRAGPIDILVNNAVLRDRRGVRDLDADGFGAVLAADLTAAYALTRVVVRRLIDRDRPGSIITVSSVVGGRLGNVDDVAYTAAKSGLEGMTRALAVELGPYGIRVNAIAPGPFATEANANDFATSEAGEWINGRSALRRFGRPEEIAGAAVFLAGDTASYVTGQVLTVDGGLSIRY